MRGKAARKANVQRSTLNLQRRTQPVLTVGRWTWDVGRLLSLQSGDPELRDLIRDKIRHDGPVTFAWFMEQALYHPQHGYYSSGRCVVGRRGDYFTNVSVGPVFATLLTMQFQQMWENLGRPALFTIVEQGAHSGQFAADVLHAATQTAPEFLKSLRYCIVEPFPVLAERQREMLRDFERHVSWCDSLENIEPFEGVHFSNELLDAMPVHLVRRVGGSSRWRERYVAEAAGTFVFEEGPLSSDVLREAVAQLPELPPEYSTEIRPAANDWMHSIAKKLVRGYLLAVDYGYPRREHYAPHRSSGTLQCYSRHQRHESPLVRVGEVDITAHVDWTTLVERATNEGLDLTGFTDQHHFFTGLISDFAGQVGAFIESERRQLQMLANPTLLGRTFDFLLLSRGVPVARRLSGWKFGRDPRVTLGLPAA